jgi:hypothetical protein
MERVFPTRVKEWSNPGQRGLWLLRDVDLHRSRSVIVVDSELPDPITQSPNRAQSLGDTQRRFCQVSSLFRG